MPYTVTSDILTVGDAIAAYVATQWNTAAPNEVVRLYQTPDPTALKSLTGRHVWIFPAEYGDEPATRGETLNSYRFGIIVCERYVDAAGAAPKAWVDERVDWVADSLNDWLNFGGDNQHAYLQIGTREIFTAEVEPVQVYDPGELIKRGLFLSELEYVFQEIKAI